MVSAARMAWATSSALSDGEQPTNSDTTTALVLCCAAVGGGALLPAHRVEVGDPVEPVAHGAHDAGVGGGVVGRLLAHGYGAVDHDHRRVPRVAVERVDALPRRVDIVAMAPRGVVDLDEQHLAAYLRGVRNVISPIWKKLPS
jgi:hypothetical protein